MKDQIHEAGMAVLTFLGGLVPAALGAAVSLTYETGLTWGQRAIQMLVGITVSFFVTNLASGIWSLNGYVAQAIGFVMGMIAFKATPKFISSCVTVAAELPGQLRDRLLAFFPKKDPK